MSLTTADIERWDADDVRAVSVAAHDRAAATFRAASDLAYLPTFDRWTGVAAEVASEDIGRTCRALNAHGNEALTVADAAHRAVAGIERVRSHLAQIKAGASACGLQVDPESDRVVLIAGATHTREIQAEIRGLQSRLDALIDDANSVDAALAASIRLADGGTPPDVSANYTTGDSGDGVGSRGPMQAMGFHDGPLPEKPSWTSPGPPPGGWSQDPITRAAQKIAYGHASTKHLSEFPPGTTRDQLASEVERIMRLNTTNPGSLIIGRTSDGAPALYDPTTNTIVIRDPGAPDAGTVFKPRNGEVYLDTKVPTRLPSIPPGELADAPPPPDPPKPKLPPEAVPRGGLPPMVGVPPMVGLPGSGGGEIPVIDVDGMPGSGSPLP